MKAIYKKHMGFEHLTHLPNPSTSPSSHLHCPVPIPMPHKHQAHSPFLNTQGMASLQFRSRDQKVGSNSNNKYEAQDTSTKKYPNNKYFQFNDQDSSGHKYLKQKLNLYEYEDENSEGDNGIEEQAQASHENENKKNQRQLNSTKPSLHFCHTPHESNRINHKTIDNPKYLQNTKNYQINEQKTPLSQNANLKNKKNKVMTLVSSMNSDMNTDKQNYSPYANSSQLPLPVHMLKAKEKSKQKKSKSSRTKANKISACTSIIEVKDKKKNHNRSNLTSSIVSSRQCQSRKSKNRAKSRDATRYIDNESSSDELRHYKKLCLSMRKRTNQLEEQLQACKMNNLHEIQNLQKKVEKISEKYQEKKENIDEDRAQKIMESLKVIKSKLSKSQKDGIFKSQCEQKKFYHFFVQSLGILIPESQKQKEAQNSKKPVHRFTSLEVQVIWKHMLQFLITKDYKIESVVGNRYLR